ncbi:phosphomannomutase/phosphoglucomutase [Desulfuromonas acetoxidans]|uniref:Phosphomannomutase n=1 Tax=Desulfuromonas acetoxidans (strain DSM 684 / 11070) TaxID=281689 RepID=Q1JYB3_DESA6|nr:phosphomannomutase/phosphoglucomutase [Desulfuromonas acetoxidans]EAT15293.1 Phosphomannomutase [Desulfuromonas acetoxidans DSM 684]MBF0645322.1 phosphomannomutase/phosphoglucomutase [Desulfuromonas acetoxidans]NVD23401.1 phosphomannomutase/phosphoglucomutase [Desulfuromonas acetoxidans]NVE15358.1 phosphomannomutase/phosphoglucomutase [Desulfuromonas acetoxidans]
MELTCFKAYDIRGRLPDELNEDIAYRIGRAYAEFLNPQKVIVGRDVRLSSTSLCAALAKGLTEAGVDVFDIGLCGTEEVYFATFSQNMDGGIMVTASHNPMDFNGMKLVREQSKPISSDTGLKEIQAMVAANRFVEPQRQGTIQALDVTQEYVDHLLGYIDVTALKPLKVVVNAGNGCAGPTIDRLEKYLPFEFIKIYHEPDGHFPNGIPNPILPENRAATVDALKTHKADVGIAWDGDFDRCFFFDETGRFIEGYYLVGLLGLALLQSNPGAKIIHDPRLVWNTVDMVTEAGGQAIQCKSGHAFIKERMRSEDAIYGGEMSAHHYFRDFSYCDSGMIPWLLVLEIMGRTGNSLSSLVDQRIALFPASGEINRHVDDAQATIERVRAHYSPQAISEDFTDGVSLEFDQWRFNLRMSNTEPVVRLNVESRGDQALMEAKTAEVLDILGGK